MKKTVPTRAIIIGVAAVLLGALMPTAWINGAGPAVAAPTLTSSVGGATLASAALSSSGRAKNCEVVKLPGKQGQWVYVRPNTDEPFTKIPYDDRPYLAVLVKPGSKKIQKVTYGVPYSPYGINGKRRGLIKIYQWWDLNVMTVRHNASMARATMYGEPTPGQEGAPDIERVDYVRITVQGYGKYTCMQ